MGSLMFNDFCSQGFSRADSLNGVPAELCHPTSTPGGLLHACVPQWLQKESVQITLQTGTSLLADLDNHPQSI